jgi:hypothetical protein
LAHDASSDAAVSPDGAPALGGATGAGGSGGSGGIAGFGHCQGTPPPCSYNATPASCTAQFGCAWPVDAGSGASCEGMASQCGSTREECLAAGCQYLNNDRYCAGKPTPCAQLSAANCTAQDGCILSGS